MRLLGGGRRGNEVCVDAHICPDIHAAEHGMCLRIPVRWVMPMLADDTLGDAGLVAVRPHLIYSGPAGEQPVLRARWKALRWAAITKLGVALEENGPVICTLPLSRAPLFMEAGDELDIDITGGSRAIWTGKTHTFKGE